MDHHKRRVIPDKAGDFLKKRKMRRRIRKQKRKNPKRPGRLAITSYFSASPLLIFSVVVIYFPIC